MNISLEFVIIFSPMYDAYLCDNLPSVNATQKYVYIFIIHKKTFFLRKWPFLLNICHTQCLPQHKVKIFTDLSI